VTAHPQDDALAAFLEENWERAPGTARHAHPDGAAPARSAPDGDAALLFAALTAAAANFRRGDPRAEFVLWIDGKETEPAPAFLPETGDGDLEGYLARMQSALRGADFTLLVSNPHLYDARFWMRARTLARRVLKVVGAPNGGLDTSAFLGCYRQTPFGVHRGQMSVLTAPVLGEKRFLLWPYAYGCDHRDIQDSLSYDRHRGAALTATAGPGDLLYWPSDYWHVAEASPAPTAAWNIGLWWDRPALMRAANALLGAARAVDRGRRRERFATAPEGGADPFSLGLADLRKIAADDALDDAVRIEWLRFSSADGFRDAPALPTAMKPTAKTPARAAMKGAILFERLGGGEFCVAANGHAEIFERLSKEDMSRLSGLARGETVDAGDPSSRLTGFLWRAGALEGAGAS